MPMRDLQHLEKLSETAAIGLWADDVVLALYRAAQSAPSSADRLVLAAASKRLAATQKLADKPLYQASSARDLAATDTALNVASTIARGEGAGEVDRGARIRELLSSMARLLDDAAKGKMTGAPTEQLEPALGFFGAVGEVQLMESNAVLTSRKDAGPWMATQMILGCS
jgi:hypothetical protein